MHLMDDAIRRVEGSGSGGTGVLLQEELQQLQQVQERHAALTEDSLDRIGGNLLGDGPSVALGTLRKLRADIEADYQATLQAEQASAADFRDLEMSKLKERRSLQQQVQQKDSQLSDFKVRLVQLKKDLKQHHRQLDEDQQSLTDLRSTCEHKHDEWQQTEASRSDELAAIEETLTLLNAENEDGGGLGSALLESSGNSGSSLGLSLLQLQSPDSASGPRGAEFIWLAMHGSQKGLNKVIERIDKFVSTLKKKATSEEQKKLYCQAQYGRLAQQAAALSTKREEAESALRHLAQLA